MKVTLYDYRHYRGRVLKVDKHICEVELVKEQANGTKLVRLLEKCMAFPEGHLIAVNPKDIN